MNTPIIRLEIERLKHTLYVALAQHSAQMDADMQAAVEEYCEPEKLGRVVREMAKQEIDRALKEEIHQFFSWSGAGRKTLREAMHALLDEKFSNGGCPTE